MPYGVKYTSFFGLFTHVIEVKVNYMKQYLLIL